MKKYLQEINLDKFFTDPSVRRGIRKKSSKDLRERQFAIELEFPPEQFSEYGMGGAPDTEAAWDEWTSYVESESEEYPQDPYDYLDDKVKEFEIRYKRYKDEEEYAKLLMWKAIKEFWTKNYANHGYTKEDLERDPWDSKVGAMTTEEFGLYMFGKYLRRTKKLDKIAAKRPYNKKIQQLKKDIGGSQKSFSFYKDSVLRDIRGARKAIRKAFEDIRKNAIATKQWVDEEGWIDTEEFEDIIELWVTYFGEGGRQEAFEYWFENYADQYDGGGVGEYEIVQAAKDMIDHNLRLSWNWTWDGSNRVEIDTNPPLTSKDFEDLLHDLEYLSQYDTDTESSAHIHIEKGKDFGDFETVATVYAADEERFSGDDAVSGRSHSYWATNVQDSVNAYHSAKTLYGHAFKIKEVANTIKRRSGGGWWGMIFDKSSTSGKTVELRYGSSTLLNNHKQIVRNIQYWMALVSHVKNRNVLIRTLEKTAHTTIMQVIVRTGDAHGGYFCTYARPKRGLTIDEASQYSRLPREAFELPREVLDALKKSGNKKASEVRREYIHTLELERAAKRKAELQYEPDEDDPNIDVARRQVRQQDLKRRLKRRQQGRRSR